MDKGVLKCPEWKALSWKEKLLYIYVKAGFDGSNSDGIYFNKSEFTRSKKNPTGEFSHGTIQKVLGGEKEKGSLIEKGWLEKEAKGGRRRYRIFYRLTGKFDILK